MLAVNEVDSSFDVAFTVKLVSRLSQKGILVSIETDAVVSLLSTVSRQSSSLRAFAVSVLDVDVVESRVCSVINNSASSFITRGTAQETRAVCDSHDVRGVATGVGSVAVDLKRGFPCGNGDLFFVCAGQDEDALGGGGGSAQRVDGGLDLQLLIQVSLNFLVRYLQLSMFLQSQQ